MTKKMVTITKEQNDFLKKNYINLSSFVRDRIDEYMEVIKCQNKKKA